MFATKAAVRSIQRNVRGVSYREVRIPVPWGHVAGKWWGPQDRRPILSLHGWQDNCGSFDLLIPTLPKHLGYLAIDLPGHGYSSWLPPGAFYHEIDYVITMRCLQRFMGWNKVSFMSHSMGATISYVFGLVYPQEVDFMICLDGLQPNVPVNVATSAQGIIENFFKYSEPQSPQSSHYSLGEMEELYSRSRKVSPDKVRHLLKRGIAETPGGKYRFTRDPRVKSSQVVGWSQESMQGIAKNVNFPLLQVLYKAHLFYEEKGNAGYFLRTLEIIKECNRDFHLARMDVEHNDHLNHHDKFTGIVTDFIMRYDKSDRSCAPIINQIKSKQ